MKKKIFSIFLVIFAHMLFAQLDREHWFAPMYDRTNTLSQRQSLYFSTNRTTPFPVEIYHNNILIGTVTLSKGNPQKFDIPRAAIITRNVSQLFTPVAMGLHVKADYAFFANLRFSTFNHAEFITSKGTSALGTTFYAAMAPITAQNSILNFMCSVMATEDNTQVTVSGYQSSVIFSNGNSGTSLPTITFTLQKGQSYIIDGRGDIAGNANAFIGAKIVSNKPVTVTNGNFNGQYATTSTLSSDILMDQSVPVEHLGQNFALVKGNGNIGVGMERPLIVATQNNTQVFVNDELTPVATLNEGQYFLMPDTKYILQNNGHYNMYIRTSKNAYVYQLLSGNDSSSNSTATGGFNFIPALNCYLPKQIDELGRIDENEVSSNANNAGILNIPTRLNIVTETGATLQVNGTAVPANSGPYPLVGNPNWVTYSIDNVSGNLTITSSKAVTAGISAGSDAVGYGGYFAGFNTTPRIVATGTCIPNIVLSVDPSNYDSYQWQLNGVNIPGATGSTFTPSIPGNYSATVTMGSCSSMETSVYTVQKCMVNSTQEIPVCTNAIISPSLSSPSNAQGLDVSTVQIITQPTRGTIVVNATTGQITYTANAGSVSGTDTFTYTFCGNNPNFPECETVVVTVNFSQISIQNSTLTACSNNGMANYNLTQAQVTTTPNTTITYYPSLVDAQNENTAVQITNPTNYTSAPNTIIYAVVKNNEGCKNIAEITLAAAPEIVVGTYTGTYCDNNFTGIIPVNLQNITNQIVTNPNYFQVRYYTLLSDANAGNNNTLTSLNITNTTTIYIRVDSPDGCPSVVKAVTLTVNPRVPLITLSALESICDDDDDGVKAVNLDAFLYRLTNETGVTATYFSSQTDANNNVNPISNPVSISGTQTFYVRINKNGFCVNIGVLTISINTPRKSTTLIDQTICPNAVTTLDAGAGFDAYLWSTGETTQSITVGPGVYTVTLNTRGCNITQSVTVHSVEQPEIVAVEIENGTATVIVQGGSPPYQYSLNGGAWQDSNVFPNLSRGNYFVYVRDAANCSVLETKFTIINLINAITPNADGINDSIDYSDLLTKENPVFKVFDRYGALVFEGDINNRFIWNGKRTPNHYVPTATYWYILEWNEKGASTRTKYSSWLLVKNVLGNMLDNR